MKEPCLSAVAPRGGAKAGMPNKTKSIADRIMNEGERSKENIRRSRGGLLLK